MSKIRKEGLAYLRRMPGYRPSDLAAVSKFYEAEESWTGKCAWWFYLPIQTIKLNKRSNYYLLCRSEKGGFIVLQVPNGFLLKNLKKFETRYQNRVRLHITSKGNEQFVDERGKGRVDFSRFKRKTPRWASRLMKLPPPTVLGQMPSRPNPQ